jgi:bifunctional DNase/RNase
MPEKGYFKITSKEVNMPHIRLEIDSIRRPQLKLFKDKATLILKEDGSERYLPIVINSLQADILMEELTSTSLSTDLKSAPGLFLSSSNVSHSDVICVTIYFDNGTYYAKVIFYIKDEPREERCSLGVALALAYRTGKPIFINSEVMDKFALALYQEWTWGAADSVIMAAKAN